MSDDERAFAVAKYEHTMRRARALGLTHGRTRKRYAQRAVLVLFVICGAVAFVAWALGLALLILIVTN